MKRTLTFVAALVVLASATFAQNNNRRPRRERPSQLP